MKNQNGDNSSGQTLLSNGSVKHGKRWSLMGSSKILRVLGNIPGRVVVVSKQRKLASSFHRLGSC